MPLSKETTVRVIPSLRSENGFRNICANFFEMVCSFIEFSKAVFLKMWLMYHSETLKGCRALSSLLAILEKMMKYITHLKCKIAYIFREYSHQSYLTSSGQGDVLNG